MFLVLVIAMGQIGLMCHKIIVMLGVFLRLPKIKSLFITCYSFCVLFDHLLQRDAAQLTFFKLCGQIDPYNLLVTNPSQSLRRHWDCLEVIRSVTCDVPRAQRSTVELFIFSFVHSGARVFGLWCLAVPSCTVLFWVIPRVFFLQLILIHLISCWPCIITYHNNITNLTHCGPVFFFLYINHKSLIQSKVTFF
jgi:hypothetical protein